MNTIRWGMISAGNIAGRFAQDIQRVDHAEVVAVAARRHADAQRFAHQHQIDTALEGYDALLERTDIDAVYISTPHTLHLEHALAALAAGKAVLCEKPITTSAAELDTLLHAARQHGQYVMEALWTWFLPAIQTAHRWVNEGRIGQLLHVKADFGFHQPFDPSSRLYDPALGGGCLLDLGIYPIALARRFFAGEPDALCVQARFAPNGVDDDIAMQFNYPQGVATLGCSLRAALPGTGYLIGTDGYIAIPYFWQASECHWHPANGDGESFYDPRQGDGFEYQIAQVSTDLQHARLESTVVTHAASRAFQRDMDQVRQSFARATPDA